MTVIRQTYIANVDSIGLGQLKGGSIRWQVNAQLFFVPDFCIFPLSKNTHFFFYFTYILTETCAKHLLLHTVITHLTDIVSILLGQYNGGQVNDTGELDSARWLAVEPFIDNFLGISNFDDIHTVLR